MSSSSTESNNCTFVPQPVLALAGLTLKLPLPVVVVEGALAIDSWGDSIAHSMEVSPDKKCREYSAFGDEAATGESSPLTFSSMIGAGGCHRTSCMCWGLL